jgi:hypothetical protein
MKTRAMKGLEVAFLLSLLLVYAVFAASRAGLSTLRHSYFRLSALPVQGTASLYACTEPATGFKQGLPAIICIGSPFQEPDALTHWIGRLGEPVLVIWCDLLADVSGDTRLDDPVVWEKKRREFPPLLSRYREILKFDEHRVYLTGSGFCGAYAWMLAYEQPEQYAGVVVTSTPSKVPHIQERIEAAKTLVTVVRFRKQPAAETERTGRLIAAQNPHSRSGIQSGGGRRVVADCWVESLKYILQFRKPADLPAAMSR